MSAPARRILQFVQNACSAVLNDRPLWRVPISVAWGMWPIFAWLIGFKKAAYIPIDWRPTIHTEWLPAADAFLVSLWGVLLCTLATAPFAWKLWISAADKLESAEVGSEAHWWASKQKLAAAVLIGYPAALSILNFLADTSVSVPKDILAFVTYGALHFASPFLGAIILYIFAAPGVGASFAWTLGFTNMASLCTHILFPNAAPWFRDLYGSPPNPVPSYTTLGNPAGLIRIDEIFGINLYHKAFKISPVVFGALPSVHSSTAMCCAIYFARYLNRSATIAIMFYTAVMFWSTMYLRHHYAADLLGGSLYCLTFFLIFRWTSLRRVDAIAEERGSTNAWQRIIWGYGSQEPPTLPHTRNGFQHEYQRVSLEYPPEHKSYDQDESFVLFDATTKGEQQ